MTDLALDPSPPLVYLTQDPSATEHALAGALGRHDGDSVPFRLFAKVCDRLHAVTAWASGLDHILRRGRRYAIAGISAAVLQIGGLSVYAINRLEAAGAAQEHALDQERQVREYRDATTKQLDELRAEVLYLRHRLDRMSGVSPDDHFDPRPHPPESAIPVLPDKLSLATPQGIPPCLLPAPAIPWLRSL